MKKSGCYRLVKNDDMQGAQISRNESYIEYVAVTRDEAQRSKSRFSTACWGFVSPMDVYSDKFACGLQAEPGFGKES